MKAYSGELIRVVNRMDILTLELLDVTVSQALTELNRALEQHPGMPLRVMLEGEEMVLHNLLRLLARLNRKVTSTLVGGRWQLDIEALSDPAPALPAAQRQPVILLRSAFAPGDRALGRRLLLGLLRAVEPPVPWVGLVHEALDLLDDPLALETLTALKDRGIPIRISRGSLEFLQQRPGRFEVMEDGEWQSLAARGEVTML